MPRDLFSAIGGIRKKDIGGGPGLEGKNRLARGTGGGPDDYSKRANAWKGATISGFGIPANSIPRFIANLIRRARGEKPR